VKQNGLKHGEGRPDSPGNGSLECYGDLDTSHLAPKEPILQAPRDAAECERKLFKGLAGLVKQLRNGNTPVDDARELRGAAFGVEADLDDGGGAK
jgi:hypothetical protein